MGLLERRVEPDVEELIAVIRRTALPKRVHHIELFLDEEIKQQVCKRFGLNANNVGQLPNLGLEIKLHSFLGYDAFRIPLAVKRVFSMGLLSADDTTGIAEQSRGIRQWSDEHSGPIQSWEDFEKYQWPKVKDINFGPLEWLAKNLPPNMGCYDLTGHILEVATMLFGYESFCFKLYDETELVDAVFERVGKFYIEYTRALCDFPCVKLIWGSDDLGFRSSTLISAKLLREKVLCWHKKCAEVAHEKGRPYLLHSCGQLEEIMDDLIDDVGIDGKHSYEDAILPVTEAKKRYGKRIAILGGIDMDFLCRADEQSIRRRVRETLEICMSGGGYCLGTGNTVANYIPLENYLAMLDEGRKFAS
jgi:uroporphyrinogen decarboxylase